MFDEINIFSSMFWNYPNFTENSALPIHSILMDLKIIWKLATEKLFDLCLLVQCYDQFKKNTLDGKDLKFEIIEYDLFVPLNVSIFI